MVPRPHLVLQVGQRTLDPRIPPRGIFPRQPQDQIDERLASAGTARYTLLDQSAFSSGFLDTCARQGVSVLAGGVFNSGFLAGGAHYDYRPASAALIEQREKLLTLCRQHGVALPAAALQFTAAHPAITSLVVGARSSHEVDSIFAARQARIPQRFWQALREARLIPLEAPLPHD